MLASRWLVLSLHSGRSARALLALASAQPGAVADAGVLAALQDYVALQLQRRAASWQRLQPLGALYAAKFGTAAAEPALHEPAASDSSGRRCNEDTGDSHDPALAADSSEWHLPGYTRPRRRRTGHCSSTPVAWAPAVEQPDSTQRSDASGASSVAAASASNGAIGGAVTGASSSSGAAAAVAAAGKACAGRSAEGGDETGGAAAGGLGVAQGRDAVPTGGSKAPFWRDKASPGWRRLKGSLSSRAATGDLEGCLAELHAPFDLAARPLPGPRDDRGGRLLRMYTLLLQKLPASRVLECYDAMLAAGVRPDGVAMYTAVSRVGDEARNVEGAERVFNVWKAGGGPYNRYAVTALCKAYSRAGYADRIEAQLAGIKAQGKTPDPQVYMQLIKAHAVRGDMASARDVLHGMAAEGITPNTHHFRALIYGYGMRGHAPRALEVLHNMQEVGVELDQSVYSALINACAESKMADEAAAILARMRQEGFKPNTHSVNSLIKAYARVGRPGPAAALVADLEASGPHPDEYSYSMLVEAHARCADPAGARAVLERMMRRGIKPGASAYTSLLNAYGEAGSLAGAYAVLTEMEAAGVAANRHSYTSIIQWAGVLGNYARAYKLYQRMREVGVEPNHITYLTLVEAAMKYGAAGDRGEHAGVLVTAERMYRSKVMPRLPPMFLATRGPDSFKLDLHGYGHYTAQLALLAALQQLADRRAAQQLHPRFNLHVVTGRGLRSLVRERPVTREVAIAFLQALGLAANLANGNEGMVVVERPQLDWLLDEVQRFGKRFDARTFMDCFVDPPPAPDGSGAATPLASSADGFRV